MAPRAVVTELARVVDEYLLGWVLLSIAVGLVVPSLSALAPLSTPILAAMVGAISLSLSPARISRVRSRALATVLVVQAGLPVLALVIARALGLAPELVVGFVVLGAVTPELVTPTLVERGGGDTALAMAALVVVGVGSLAFLPGMLALLVGGSMAVDPWPAAELLLLAVVLPMTVAIGVRARWPERVAAYDDVYPSVSSLMVVLIVGIVIAANASLVRSGGPLLVVVLIGAVALNGAGYAAGWLVSRPFERPERIAATLTVGMRDFAVAAAVLVGAGFPPSATLPAVVFGVVELASSAGLATWFARDR